MKNDTQIKVTCLTNKNKEDELHFDYYDKEGNIVGTVAVDENGRLGWTIWNIKHQPNILYNASYIYGEKIENSIEYILEAKKKDSIRWDRAQDFIDFKGLVVNYQQNRYFGKEFKNGFKRR